MLSTRRVSALVLGIAGLTLALASEASADLLIFDDFSSYPLEAKMHPLPSGLYVNNWMSGPLTVADEDIWRVMASPAAASHGQHAGTFGGGPVEPHRDWLSFSATDDGPITSAILNFDYLVQTNAELRLSILSDPAAGFVAVPFTFTKRSNVGEIVDNTRDINLTPYLSGDSSHLTVRFDVTTSGSPFTHVYVDNFSLSTHSTAVPLPSVACSAMVMLGVLLAVGRPRPKFPSTVVPQAKHI